MNNPATIGPTRDKQADKSSLVGHTKDVFVGAELEITHHRLTRVDHIGGCRPSEMGVVEDLNGVGCDIDSQLKSQSYKQPTWTVFPAAAARYLR